MNRKFNIRFSAYDENNLPISVKVNDYLEDFIRINILEPKKIIVNAKMSVVLVMLLKDDEPGYREMEVVDILKPRKVKEENIKLFWYILPLTRINESKNELHKLVQLTIQAVKMFFTEYYHKADKQFLENVFNRIDYSYLSSIKYPAAISEQEKAYMG
ncbi:MAG: hypothetical protein JNL72_04940 [Flavipsychrobacter sp.]|nr:hypothetical protein [Flavipsychrobacter sp.]